ncbi:papain-like cysteine protease family protein [Kitasatospora aureofaciens]|uniref:papain-like cysteine protease family protein n=1 Tax=Kitasatospora aureofaciens TaxID=1894 RepID=UPI001C454DDB|nr:papain-like cysteine protease family protein [Kitasatospora aureofaciens]MBV6701093.1 C39 family peptidase [Kitasatospora aureofaciens]
MPVPRIRLRRAVSVLALGVLGPALTAAATTPAAAAPGPDQAPTLARAHVQVRQAAAPGSTADLAGTYKKLNITMQQQQQTNWCWAASGNTIATWFGYSYSQNQFCNAAFGRSIDSSCPNSQATLGDVQNALDWIGITPGSYVTGYLRYSTVQAEVDANRPVETRIQWSSGGGHMHVVYGYDTGNNWVYWGDPWPSNYRYNWADYWYYVNNDTFSWTHSLYRIGA